MTDHEPNTTGHDTAAPAPAGGATASTINRPWLTRIVVIVACLLGYAAWSLFDAFIGYPERGAAFSSWAEWQYLGLAIEADRSESPGVLRREAAVIDPVAELEELRANRTDNESDRQGGSRQKRAAMELAREEWLDSLTKIGRLHPAYTNFYGTPDEEAAEAVAKLTDGSSDAETMSGLLSRLEPTSPKSRFTELSSRWNNEAPPGKLRSYDIPVNKIQALVCIGFSGYLLYLFVNVATRTYRWDPDSHTLTLPSGESIAPADLEDVDKRKWDKFIVFLRIKDAHSQLGGREIKFDTYRHGLVEDWILEMERVAFPDRVSDSDDADAAKDADSEAPADTSEAADEADASTDHSAS